MTAALAAFLFALSALPALPGVLVSAYAARVLAALKANPVRTLGYALGLAVVAASAATGTPLAVILGQVGAFVAVVERVRAVVAPMARVLVHVDDIPADDEGLPPVVIDDLAAPAGSES